MSIQISAEGFHGWHRCHLQQQTIPNLMTSDWKGSPTDGKMAGQGGW